MDWVIILAFMTELAADEDSPKVLCQRCKQTSTMLGLVSSENKHGVFRNDQFKMATQYRVYGNIELKVCISETSFWLY